MTDSHTLALGGLQVRWTAVDGEPARVTLDGDLDNLSVPVLRQALDALYDEGRFTITLELAGLAFIDSSGLGAMVGAWRRCQREGGTVVASHPTETVRRLMDMTGISKFLVNEVNGSPAR